MRTDYVRYEYIPSYTMLRMILQNNNYIGWRGACSLINEKVYLVYENYTDRGSIVFNSYLYYRKYMSPAYLKPGQKDYISKQLKNKYPNHNIVFM